VKQPHRRLALSEPLQHGVRNEIKDFHGALLSSWPLNWGTGLRRFPSLRRNNSPIREPRCLRLEHGGDHHD
jgi:hypothetical protein